MSNDADRQGKYISRHRHTETDHGIRGLRRRSRLHSDSEYSQTLTHSSEYDSDTHSTGVRTTTSASMDEDYQSHMNKFLCCCVSLQFLAILILLTLVSLLISESWFGATLPFSKKQTEYDANWREEPNPETPQTASLTYDKANTTIPSCSGNACEQNSNDGIIFSDDFDFLDFDKWKHVLTLSGGGNWEFQAYTNNRTNSFIKDGKLHIKPTFTNDLNPHVDDWVTTNGANLNIWGMFCLYHRCREQVHESIHDSYGLYMLHVI